MRAIVFLFLFFSEVVLAHDGCKADGKVTASASELLENICIMPQVGVPQDVRIKRADGTVRSAYRLNKTKDGNFIAEINPIFFEEGKVPSELLSGIAKPSNAMQAYQRTNKGHQQYSAKVKKCLTQYSGSFRGPNNEKLTIKVTENADIPAAHIEMNRAGARSNARGYASDIDCQTVLHEVFHLLGLVDEYREVTRGYAPKANSPNGGYDYFPDGGGKINAYDCRAKSPLNSIMNIHHTAIKITAKASYVQVRCKCDQNMKSCLSFMESQGEALYDLEGCPNGFSEVIINKGAGKKSDARDVVVASAPTGSFEISIDMREKAAKTGGTVPSILMPAHFRAITSPYCYAANRKYFECSQFAYKTSIFEPGKVCSSKAKQCQASDDWLK